MTYRTDKFKVGDNVTWANEEYANMADAHERFGDGPFPIVKIDDVDRHFRSVGHTQWPHIMTYNGAERFSGAFFKVVE